MDMQQLNQLCASFHQRLKQAVVRVGAARVVILGLTLLLAFMLFDWWLHLGTGLRLLNLAAYLAFLGATAWWTVVRPIMRPWNREETLRHLDSIMPEQQGMLLELSELIANEGIQETQSAHGKSLAEDALQNIAPLAETAREIEYVEKTLVRGRIRRALAAVAVFAVLCLLVPEHAQIGARRFFNPLSTVRWPHRTTVHLEEPERGWSVPALESLTIDGEVTGVIPHQVTLSYRDETTGQWIRENINLDEDNAFSYTFHEMRDPVSFHIAGGDFVTDTYTIEIVQRPYIRNITAHYEYPDYAGIPDRSIGSGQLSGLEGTRVQIEIEPSMPLEKALFIFEDEDPEEITRKEDGHRFVKDLVLIDGGTYRVELYEARGYREVRPHAYDIRVRPNPPPEIRFTSPGRNLSGTRQASVDIAFQVTDDYGLQEVKFFYQVNDEEPRELGADITGPISQRGRHSEGRFNWRLD